MAAKPLTTAEYKHTLNMYVSGFILSIVLTMAAYVIVQAHLGGGKQVLAQPTVLMTILGFAVAQLIVQLWFFLHLGEEAQPRWRLQSLLLAIGFVFIIVAGSIWIMANLDYHGHQTQKQINTYIKSQDDL